MEFLAIYIATLALSPVLSTFLESKKRVGRGYCYSWCDGDDANCSPVSLASHTYFGGGSGRNTYGDYGQLFGNNRERFQKLRPRNVMRLVAHAAQLSLSSLSDCLLLTVTQLTIGVACEIGTQHGDRHNYGERACLLLSRYT